MIEHLRNDERYAGQPSPEHRKAPQIGAGAGFPIAIIGAGFAGIAMAIQLKRAGFTSFTIFERAREIGGTWRDNTYPGAACDVPSHAYSLSFEPNPDWSRKFSPAPEIQNYLLGLVDKWRLREHIHFSTAIERAVFDEERGRWTLETSNGASFVARVVISAVGGLVDPKWPDIRGIQSFGGALFHTARWNHDFDLRGKRVAVLGTGASAVQVIPAIARTVEHLDVYQRTPAWVMPKGDGEYDPNWRGRFRRHPWTLQLSRAFKYWTSELFGPMVYLDAPRLSARAERISLRHLESQVKDPALRAKLTPDFQFGCKRVLISDDYWASFERDNVDLITEGVTTVTPAGIVTSDGRERDYDALVCATGFETGLATAPFTIVGRGGRMLEQEWKAGAAAYKGVAVAGYPNWFILMGPNTGPGHTSVLVFTEAQIRHAMGAIGTIRRDNLRFVEVRREAQDRYGESISRRMPHMVWSNCRSWYLSDDGSNRALYPGPAFEYVSRTSRFEPRDYECVSHSDGGPHDEHP